MIAIIDDVVQKANDPDVASEGIETLGQLNDPRARARVARGNGNVDLRRNAIETYAESRYAAWLRATTRGPNGSSIKHCAGPKRPQSPPRSTTPANG